MPFYLRAGSVPNKRHIQYRRPDGGLYAEELFSVKGFSGVHSLLYHCNPPTAVLRVEPWKRPPIAWLANDPLRNRHWETGGAAASGDAVDARFPLLGNDDIRVSLAHIDAPMESFYRITCPARRLNCTSSIAAKERWKRRSAEIAYRAHDYLVIPTAVTYRLQPRTPTRALVYELSGAVEIPRAFRNAFGQLAEHAPYCERDIRPPRLRDPVDTPGEYIVRTAHRERGALHVMRNHPFDAIGWDGQCWPFAFNLDEYAPVTGKLHQPPPTHATFEAPGAAFCAFVPRAIDYHPQAVPIPYNHANVNCDEVLYYVSGDFLSRRSIAEGSLTLHPAGAVHGPQPGAVEASLGRAATNELAVMVDTFAPLHASRSAACDLEDDRYFLSWLA